MGDWRFYGREQELAKVRRRLQLDGPGPYGRAFAAYTLLGRRAIGKSLLLNEAMKGMESAPPFLMVELPPGGREVCLEALEREIQVASLEYLMEDMPADAGRRWATANPQGRFADILSHLIEKGVTVCLDEFHNAKEGYLEGPLKLMIDHYATRPVFGEKKPTGKLVITSSHQQHLLRMLSSDAPLFGRTKCLVRLRQWPISTTFEMAAEQGILALPERFLTLWTAWGGLPHRWERLATDSDYADILDPAVIPNDGEWRHEFLRVERETLGEPLERVDGKAVVDLTPDLRDALIWMSRRSARGGPIGEIAAALGGEDAQDVHQALFNLEQHLELVRFEHPQFSGPSRWWISDNNTLFQLSVFRDLYTPGRQFPLGAGSEITWLKNLEGPMLVRLTEEWLRERAGQEWVESGIRFRSPAGASEIDVAALMQQEGGVKLVLGECKRTAAQHRPGQLAAVFDGFMASLADEGLPGRMRRADKEFRLLISPEFTPGERRRLRDGRFEPLDIRQMAKMSGIELAPRPGKEVTAHLPSISEAKTEPKPKPDDSPELGI